MVESAAGEAAAPQEVEPGLLERQADGAFALVGGRCERCGAHSLRLSAVCPSCWSEGSLRPQALSRVGRVASTFVARTAPPGFVAPYAFALIDLPEGLRVLMRVEAADGGAIEIGDPVEVDRAAIGRTEAGADLFGPVFRRR